MNKGYPQGGLAALLASQGRGDDKVLVHMTPGEVRGLQSLAQSAGGSLTLNPRTGLPEAGFLKSLLPAIAGFTLNRIFPGLGSTATSAIVGGATGLIEGSFKKGLNAGFSAYSGSNISEGLRRAAAVRMAPPKTLAQQLGLKEEELLDYGDLTKPDTDKETFGVRLPQTTTPLPAISPVTPKPSKSGIFEGIKGLATEEGRKAFTTGLEGGYTSPFGKMASKYATSLGIQAALTPTVDEEDMKGGQMSKPRYYIPGDYNPNYGKGYGEWLFKPGYFTDKYPGYAGGGMIFGEERFADGGEVMVSPGAVLPQTITTYQPSFTQDRAGLGQYYESLLVPPDMTPRDTSALQAYLDALRARLKRPYQPYGPGTGTDTGGDIGGGGAPGSGGTVTPPGNDPFATGVTGTPIEFIQPEVPERPSVPGIEHEFVGPNIPMSGVPDYVKPDKKDEITIIAEPGTTAEDFTGVVAPTPSGTPDYVKPDKEDEITIIAEPGTTAEDFTGVVAPTPSGTPDYVKPDKEDEITVIAEPGTTAEDFTGVVAPTPSGTPDYVKPKEEAIKYYDPNTGFEIDPNTGDIIYPTGYSPAGFAGTGAPAPAADKVGSATVVAEPGTTTEEFTGEIEKKEEKNIIDEIVDAVRENKPEIAGYLGSAVGGPLVGAALENVVKYFIGTKQLTPEEEAAMEAEAAAKAQAEAEAAAAAAAKAQAEREAAEREAAERAERERQELERIRAEIAASEKVGTSGSYYPMLPSLSQERFGLANAMGGDVFGPIYSGTIYSESGDIIPENVDLSLFGDYGMASGGVVPRFAQGGLGSLQQYAVGGKLVNGAGDGMSDDIKANISGHQEARLADGEFVIPADVVSHLGNGSTDAGAKQLYAMMDRIRKARTGRERQAPEVEARKYMPA